MTHPQAGAPVAGEALTIGDYVLATKYHDGDPGDMWALGFYAGPTHHSRHLVNDAAGKGIRANGFRRVGKVSEKMGAWLLNVATTALEQCPPGTVNLWKLLDPDEGQPHRSEPDQGDSYRHTDDVAVDAFALAMKQKLAMKRAEGRCGWEDCAPEVLSKMLRDHVGKGDPLDVANFAMMLWTTYGGIVQDSEQRSAGAVGEPVAPTLDEVIDALNVFNKGDEPWLASDAIAVDALPAFIHRVGRAWYAAPTASGDARDAERLDFLIANVERFVISRVIDRQLRYGLASSNDEPLTWHDSPRAAIDAARGDHD